MRIEICTVQMTLVIVPFKTLTTLAGTKLATWWGVSLSSQPFPLVLANSKLKIQLVQTLNQIN